MKTFFASDLHFGHKNILIYEPIRLMALFDKYVQYNGRFETFGEFELFVKSMLDKAKLGDTYAIGQIGALMKRHDQLLIDNWNNVVSEEDTVWFLGDLALNKTKAQDLLQQLNGKKNIILGNHDNGSLRFYYDIGFKFVSRRPIVLKQKFILTHAPLETILDKGPLVQIYGHVHSNPNYETYTDKSICACLERHNLTPFEIPEFDKNILEDQTMNSK